MTRIVALRCFLFGICLCSTMSPALAMPVSAPHHVAASSLRVEVRSLRAGCACRPRSIKRVAVAKPKKQTIIVTFSVKSREERRRKKHYDIPDIPKAR